jgi:hypothetical protein
VYDAPVPSPSIRASRGLRPAALLILGAIAACAAVSGRPSFTALALSLAAISVLATAPRGALPSRRRGAVVLVLLLLSAWNAVETSGGVAPPQVVVTQVLVPAPPADAWEALKSFDALHGPLPALLSLGLPVPERCALEKDAVGAKRVCYFGTGTIEQRVIAWDPPHRMRLAVVEVDLPGRRWFGFTEAGYDLEAQPRGTLVTRSTRATSDLRPGWLWGPLVRLGVQQEHRYLLAALARRFDH